MRVWLAVLYSISCLFVLVGCGAASQEKVVSKLEKKWDDAKGYELSATMEMKTGSAPKSYDVVVWHTKPDFYRVQVTSVEDQMSQMIVRNKEGVFVVTPSLNKMYKFQSDWPQKNSQAYLVSALIEDLKADQKATMNEGEKTFDFRLSTQNSEKTGMTSQKIVVNKETLLPQSVSLYDDAEEERIVITFKDVKLGVAHKPEEYAIEKFTENEQKETTSTDKESNEPTSSVKQTYYPIVKWENTKLIDEQTIREQDRERVVLTFEGDKGFTLVQEPAKKHEAMLPVAMTGDIVDLGFTIGSSTESSISWEQDGVSFFIASTNLTMEEMIEVAASLTTDSMK